MAARLEAVAHSFHLSTRLLQSLIEAFLRQIYVQHGPADMLLLCPPRPPPGRGRRRRGHLANFTSQIGHPEMTIVRSHHLACAKNQDHA